MSGRIVVGVDGSEESVQSLRWALEEARGRHATVAVVHAWQSPNDETNGVPGVPAGTQAGDDPATTGRAVLRAALDAVSPNGAGVPIDLLLVEGAAAARLLDAAAHADLLVVGSHGRSGPRPPLRRLLGSVAEQCSQHAPCPVVVVPRNR